MGRAEEWGWGSGCCCDELLITPNGDIFACGCQKVKMGTVYEPAIPDDYPGDDGCCSEKEREAN
jgi:sulfatase maturation enzyme AslB (radical SAM superfamily)